MKTHILQTSIIVASAFTLGLQSMAHDHSAEEKSKAKTASRKPVAELTSKGEETTPGGEAGDARLSASAWVNLGDELMQKSREVSDEHLYERASRAYRAALLQDPDHVGAMIGLAWVHNTRHDFEEGRVWAEKALEKNPFLPQAHALLGDAAIETGDYEGGLAHFQQALDIRPDLSTYSRAAHVVWLMGDVRKSRSLMEKAIKAGGGYAENVAWCRAELANIHWHDGALLPAEQKAELALKAAPTNAHVLAIAGKIKAAKRNFPQAITLYQRAIEIRPTHDALVGLGDIYAMTGRTNEAGKLYQEVIKFHAEHEHHGSEQDHTHDPASGNAQLARFYADHDRNLDEAIQEAELAYKTFKNVFVADTLAWCYYKKGLYEKAREMSTVALRSKTPDAAIYFHAGLIHDRLGETGKAQYYLNKALNLNPTFHPEYGPLATETLQKLAQVKPGRND